jgi:hypothetical protein
LEGLKDLRSAWLVDQVKSPYCVKHEEYACTQRKSAGVADHLPKPQIVEHRNAWKAKEGSAVFYGNTTLQARYCRSVLGLADILQKYLYEPSKITKGALFIVQISLDQILIIEIRHIRIRNMI